MPIRVGNYVRGEEEEREALYICTYVYYYSIYTVRTLNATCLLGASHGKQAVL